MRAEGEEQSQGAPGVQGALGLQGALVTMTEAGKLEVFLLGKE